MDNFEVYNQLALEYDHWFDEHPILFESELQALKKVVPKNEFGVEIGIGSGRFAEKLAIDRGLDPSEKMAQLAETRGVKTLIGKAENIPFTIRKMNRGDCVQVQTSAINMNHCWSGGNIL